MRDLCSLISLHFVLLSLSPEKLGHPFITRNTDGHRQWVGSKILQRTSSLLAFSLYCQGFSGVRPWKGKLRDPSMCRCSCRPFHQSHGKGGLNEPVSFLRFPTTGKVHVALLGQRNTSHPISDGHCRTVFL